jgi:hypothetical protein
MGGLPTPEAAEKMSGTSRVARWFLFKPKVPIWENFSGPQIVLPFWNILWIFGIFGIFYDLSLHIVFIWYIFSSFGIMHQEKSGNPGRKHQVLRESFPANFFCGVAVWV